MPPRGEKDAHREKDEKPSPLPYTVEMTASTEAVYVDLFRKAKAAESSGHPESAHSTTFNMVKEAVKTITPNDPPNKRYALRGKLSNIFRLRKGRLRICWIASSRMRRICILFIAQTLRKQGDANDPYVIFQNLLESGRFDEVMQELKVKMPHGKR
jgi:mRNA-degrading endonuclease RelE of RelBE toxin-antitoxin system